MIEGVRPVTDLPKDLLVAPKWQERLDELAAKHSVPGAQVGVIALGEDCAADIRVITTGVTSLNTRVDVDADTLFQYGSASKIWTTTLIMQLVDEGKLTLDTLVVEVLPEFTIADPSNTKEITIRQLLTHTSGIDGDLFNDTGDGDDCVEKYVDELATAISVTEPGGHLSYSNAGFAVAGRIVEVLREMTWDEALVEYLWKPLGLTHIITKAKDAPLFRTAVGHVANPDRTSPDKVIPTKQWLLPRGIGPAGIITGSVSSLLTFGAAHMRDGLALTGERILSEESARLMRTPQFDLTAVSSVDQAWGLGWILSDWGGVTSAQHGGATIGQITRFHTFPELGLAMAVVTNSRGGGALAHDIEKEIAQELDLVLPEPKSEPNAEDIDLSHILGTYESTTVRIELTRGEDGGFQVQNFAKVEIDGEPPAPPTKVVPLSASRFSISNESASGEMAHLTIDGEQYLYMTRLFKKISD
ncbi:penicillin-binding protein [Rhodococcus qingshengii]|nr:penicillin-binding protein [Rhodococcus qingshengii]KSU79899.1 penicillin-binding protein [Rhodococcus qingshengii]OMQ32368.1 penicillin-binding protein [Rhodococcus sp. D-1]